MGPLGAASGGVGGEDGGHPHVGAQGRCQLLPRGHRRLGGGERVEHQQPGRTPGRAVMRQPLLEGRAAGQRRHVTHPEFRRGQLLNVVEHALGDAQGPRRVPGRGDGHQAHPGGRRRSPVRPPGEQFERAACRDEHVGGAVVVGPGSLEPLDIPAVVEADLGAGNDGDPHLGETFTDPAHLAVVHRQESGGNVVRVPDSRTEVPRPGDGVAAVDGGSLSVGKELTAHGDAVVVGGEHLGEALVRQVCGGGEGRRQIGDPHPAERPVLPSHFDPGLDHLGERRLDAAGGDGVERRHQPAGPHLVDDRRSQGAHAFGFGGLGSHQLAHAARERDDPVFGVGDRRHGGDRINRPWL